MKWPLVYVMSEIILDFLFQIKGLTGKKRCYCDTLSVEKKKKKQKLKELDLKLVIAPFEKKLDEKNRCVKL